MNKLTAPLLQRLLSTHIFLADMLAGTARAWFGDFDIFTELHLESDPPQSPRKKELQIRLFNEFLLPTLFSLWADWRYDPHSGFTYLILTHTCDCEYKIYLHFESFHTDLSEMLLRVTVTSLWPCLVINDSKELNIMYKYFVIVDIVVQNVNLLISKNELTVLDGLKIRVTLRLRKPNWPKNYLLL